MLGANQVHEKMLQPVFIRKKTSSEHCTPVWVSVPWFQVWHRWEQQGCPVVIHEQTEQLLPGGLQLI